MINRTTAMSVVAAAVCATNGCTAITQVDVCERRGSPEHDINTLTEGNQSYNWPPSVAPIAGGGAFVAFESQRPGLPSVVRIVRVGPQASVQRTCTAVGDATIVSSTVDAYDSPVIAFPQNQAESDTGLVVYREVSGADQRLWAVQVTENGCAAEGALPDPFVLHDPAAGVQILNPQIVPIGNNRMVISWNELSAAGLVDLRGRVVNLIATDGVIFPPTRLAPDGAAVTIPPDGDFPALHATVNVGDTRFAMIWYEAGVRVARVRFAVFDDRFEVVAGPVLVDEKSGIIDPGASVAAAFDGAQFLLAWVLGDSETAGRAEAIFLDLEGRFLRSERSADGTPFLLGPAVAIGIETHLSVTRLDGGGFLAAWALLEPTGGDTGADLYAIAFNADGDIDFSTRACDRSHFAMNLDREGTQQWPVIRTLHDGTTLFVYANEGGVSGDRSGFGIRGTGLRASDLVVR